MHIPAPLLWHEDRGCEGVNVGPAAIPNGHQGTLSVPVEFLRGTRHPFNPLEQCKGLKQGDRIGSQLAPSSQAG